MAGTRSITRRLCKVRKHLEGLRHSGISDMRLMTAPERETAPVALEK